jgi:hypothetical protein
VFVEIARCILGTDHATVLSPLRVLLFGQEKRDLGHLEKIRFKKSSSIEGFSYRRFGGLETATQ